MRWTRGYRSNDVDDRRAQGGGGRGLSGSSVGLLFTLFRTFGLPGVLVGGVLLYFAGGFSGGSDSSPLAGGAPGSAGPDAERGMVEFVSFVLDDAQSTYTRLLTERNERYRNARLVLFRGGTQSGCGYGESAMGPFYCPGDERVYIDLAFYEELRQRFGAPGDFAQAYVIAHEIGHHVQNLLGISARVKGGSEGADGASVRLELQADCFAGVWGNGAQQRDLLEPGDLDEALRAAAAIGDDQLQRQATGRVRPDSFTHGTSEQRVRWFRRGFERGSMDACDTFAATSL